MACLKDLKKWLKLYDEKANRLDVARCLAEANLVEGDLLEILGAWPEDGTEDKVKLKIALSCCMFKTCPNAILMLNGFSGTSGAPDMANGEKRLANDCQPPQTCPVYPAGPVFVQARGS